ncbi:MAG: hypothetical protein AAGA06_08000 [Pseudomonadota bacterium]
MNARQKENHNFQKVAGHLASYGFNCLRLSDDWNGADFLACHNNGVDVLRVQLKGRFTLDRTKYEGKAIHIAFLQEGRCYLFPHDEMQRKVLKAGKFQGTKSWDEGGAYSTNSKAAWLMDLLVDYEW